MAARLRYLAHDLEVPLGQFVIGRTLECQLSLDDPQVSRRHALLTVTAQRVILADLGSRNGVEVNGKRLTEPQTLAEGDRIRIGGQEMTLHISEVEPTSARSSPQRRAARTSPESTRDMNEVVLEDPTSTTSIVSPDVPPSHPDRRVHSLVLIGGLAEKAFAMGRPEDAERLLQRPLHDLLAKAHGGEDVSTETMERAATYALRVAGATGRGTWVDYVFALYAALQTVLPGKVVDELYAVVRKVKHIDKGVLKAYTTCLRESSSGFGPSERFLQQRIESLERWAP